ncbi:hypothetical protein EVAR_93787_1 [Eumeta japonica]|uniref:Uncharacterized protein n=1 Tax=Eumeta variegata TaxID=151549 RepID=A0A4C1VDR8_EUMVA|nr:hypothetical protein EVAR_93787_1 [Eumeta japonica]
MPPRVPEIKGLGRRTDGQQSDPIRVPFFLLRYGTLSDLVQNSVGTTGALRCAADAHETPPWTRANMSQAIQEQCTLAHPENVFAPAGRA